MRQRKVRRFRRRLRRISYTIFNPQFWSIVIIFVLITLHHYDDQTMFQLFARFDPPLRLTRHTIDRILYLFPIVLSSMAFGFRGGAITLALAFAAMMPRALFISSFGPNAVLETLFITAIGSLAPLWARYFKKQDERLKLTEERYQQLFENAHDAIWVQDLAGEIIAANEAAAKLFRCELHQLVGANARDFYTQEDFDLLKLRQKNMLGTQGDHVPYTQEIIRRDDSTAHVMLTSNPLLSNGNLDGIQFIGRDMTKELQMQENQGFYLQQITRAHEDERQRISRDLHDSTAQNLIATLRQLEKFCEEDGELSAKRLEQLWNLHGQIKETLHEVRQISRDLRPSIIDNLGFLPAVQWLAEQLQIEHNVSAEVNISGEERRFPPEIEVALFRIVQEALRNIAKHASAAEAKVSINFKQDETVLIIADDGAGFALPATLGELSRQGKLGVDGMHTRARLVGGTLDIQSKPGFGTTIVAVIPN